MESQKEKIFAVIAASILIILLFVLLGSAVRLNCPHCTPAEQKNQQPSEKKQSKSGTQMKIQKAAISKFAPGAITAGGEIGHRMALATDKILDHIDIRNTFSRHFKVRKKEPEMFGGFSGYSMLLDSIVKGAANSAHRQKEMIKLKEKLLTELKDMISPDGNISMFSDKTGIWDSHEQAYFIQALVRDHQYFGKKGSLESARKIAAFLMERNTPPNLGLEEAFLLLYEVEKRQELLDFTRNNFKIDKSAKEFDMVLRPNGVRHVYTYLARACAQLKYLDLDGTCTGDIRKFILRAVNRIRTGGYVCITGACTGMAVGWGEVWDCSHTGLKKTGETCASAYLMRFCTAMLQRTGDSVWGDIFERVMYNTFFAAQSKDGLKCKYFVPFQEPGEWYERDTYCCPNNFKRMIYEIPESIFLKKDNGIIVNLYSQAVLKTKSAEFEMQTAYPENGKVSLRVKCAPAAEFPLFLRVPSWCRDFKVRIGDRVLAGTPGTFLEIVRKWHNDTLEIEMPMPFRLIRGVAAQERKTALMKGPCVYGLPADSPVSLNVRACTTAEAPLQLKENAEGAELLCTFQKGDSAKSVQFKRFSEHQIFLTYIQRRKPLESVIADDELFSFQEEDESYL